LSSFEKAGTVTIWTDREDTRWTVHIHGRFEFSCRAEFRAAYTAAPKGMSYWVDLSAVNYVDSAALGMLLMLRDHAGEDAAITLSGCKGQPDQVLKIAQFHKMFHYE